MGKAKHIYNLLAGLLEYPGEDIKLRAAECVTALGGLEQYPPEVVEELKKFQKDLEHISMDDLRGIYSYTFELTSDFTLDMGYHIYDGFRRSNSLASIKGMYQQNGFQVDDFSKGELPDHLPVILYFLGFCENEELKKDFRETFLVRALEKLQKNFERNKKNLYWHLINAIYRIIDKDVKGG